MNDAIILSLFQAAGLSAVSVTSPRERKNASYPSIIVYGYEDNQESYGDNTLAIFFWGRFKLEIVTRSNPNIDEDALGTLRAIQVRIQDILLGNPLVGFSGIKGQNVSANYRCDVFHQSAPTGYLPTTDPTYERWGSTYKVMMNRIGY